MRTVKTTIVSNEKIAEQYKVMTFKWSSGKRNIAPGQFFNIKVRSGSTPLLRRPFGAYKIGKGTAAILYKVVGEATKIMAAMKTGDTIDCLGPLGNGFNVPSVRSGMETVLVGGGHGVAPLLALAAELKKTLKKAPEVFIGGRSREHIVADREFSKLGARVRILTDDGSRGKCGPVTKGLAEYLKSLNGKKAVVYACGPRPMLECVAGICKKYGTECQVSMEEYLGCGIGVCVGCAIRTTIGRKLICKDGPVFDAEEIIW